MTNLTPYTKKAMEIANDRTVPISVQRQRFDDLVRSIYGQTKERVEREVRALYLSNQRS